MKRTAVQQRAVLNSIVKQAYGSDTAKAENVMMEIQESINGMLEEEHAEKDGLYSPKTFEDDVISEILEDSGVHEDKAEEIINICKKEFQGDVPTVENLLDTKAIKANAPIKREKELVKEVLTLKDQLKKSKEVLAGLGIEDNDVNNRMTAEELAYYNDSASSVAKDTNASSEVTINSDGDFVVRVSSDKAELIRTEMIDGRKCIVIPMEENQELKLQVVE